MKVLPREVYNAFIAVVDLASDRMCNLNMDYQREGWGSYNLDQLRMVITRTATDLIDKVSRGEVREVNIVPYKDKNLAQTNYVSQLCDLHSAVLDYTFKRNVEAITGTTLTDYNELQAINEMFLNMKNRVPEVVNTMWQENSKTGGFSDAGSRATAFLNGDETVSRAEAIKASRGEGSSSIVRY